MVSKTNQMKSFVGLILEAVFLAFIVGFSFSSSQPANNHNKDLVSISSSVLIQSAVWRSNQNLDAGLDLDVKSPSLNGIVPVFSIDLPALKISNARAFFISIFERSTFYVFTSINAP